MRKVVLVLLAMLAIAPMPSSAQATPQVVLTWTASTSTGVTGYNVYKLTGACPATISLSAFSKLASTTTALTYTDTAVTAGSTYCYVVTATTATAESAASGSWQVTVPTYTASTIPLPPPTVGPAVQ